MFKSSFSAKQVTDDAIEAISKAVVYFDPDDHKRRNKCRDRTFSAANIHEYCKSWTSRTRNTNFEVDNLKRAFHSQIIRNALGYIISCFEWEPDGKKVSIISGEFRESYKIGYRDLSNASDYVLSMLKMVLELDVSAERSEISAALQANLKEAVEAIKDKALYNSNSKPFQPISSRTRNNSTSSGSRSRSSSSSKTSALITRIQSRFAPTEKRTRGQRSLDVSTESQHPLRVTCVCTP